MRGQWYTGELEYEGFPLILRFQGQLDFDALQILYPKLVVITHTLETVKPNGLPEPDYNSSLLDFDQELIATVQESGFGLVVLVETFGGRRIYYFYVSPEFQIEQCKHDISVKYPQQQLEWSIHDDKDWNFIREYADKYNFPM